MHGGAFDKICKVLFFENVKTVAEGCSTFPLDITEILD